MRLKPTNGFKVHTLVPLMVSSLRVTSLPLTTDYFFIVTTTTPDPITPNTERVLVRNTVTGFEQGIAATAGLFTAGPAGALASWATIRGVQGKWTPWFILGIPASIVLNLVQLATLGFIIEATNPEVELNEPTRTEYQSFSK